MFLMPAAIVLVIRLRIPSQKIPTVTMAHRVRRLATIQRQVGTEQGFLETLNVLIWLGD